MSYLDTLRARRHSKASVEQLIRLRICDERYGVLCCVEGEEDEEYYLKIFETLRPNLLIASIVCDGKGGVLGARTFIDSFYDGHDHVVYLIDRDHDEFLGLDYARGDTFVTGPYSIEWYCCTIDVLTALIFRYYKISKTDPLCLYIRQHLESELDKFFYGSKRFMRVALSLRLRDDNIDLDKTNLRYLFDCRGGMCRYRNRSSYEKLERLGVSNNLKYSDIVRAYRLTYFLDRAIWIRGKLLMEWFCWFFNSVPDICKNKVKLNGRLVSSTMQLSGRLYISHVLDWIKVPKELEIFVRRL